MKTSLEKLVGVRKEPTHGIFTQEQPGMWGGCVRPKPRHEPLQSNSKSIHKLFYGSFKSYNPVRTNTSHKRRR